MHPRLKNIFALIIGGVLLSSAWPPLNLFVGLMLGFIPLLLVEEKLSSQELKWRKWRVFGSAYLFLAVFNFCGIWWSAYAAGIAVIAEVVINSLFFSIVFLLFSQTKRYLGKKVGYMAFAVFWLAFEYIEIQDWDLAWSWLTLGYGLSDHTWMIQWYEYSGALGGSLWILILNLMFFKLYKGFKQKALGQHKRLIVKTLGVLVLPMIISLSIFWTHEEKGKEAQFVVVQPNIDPYKGLFMDSEGNYLKRYARRGGRTVRLLELADQKVDQNVDFLLFPESALGTTLWEGHENSDSTIVQFRRWLKKYPKLSVVAGAGYKTFYEKEGEELPPDVHRHYSGRFYYKRHNSAVLLNNTDQLEVYHKSKLVIGVEQIPPYFVFLQRYLEDFDHDKKADVFNPNNSIQDKREVFQGRDGDVKLAPVVCFEVNFGEFMQGYIAEGANVLGVVTNEGWWQDTPGYKHLFAYSRIRAIETRRSMARAANTGWSGFINQRGDVISRSEFWEPAVLKEKLQLNNEVTFYMSYGDIIGRLSVPFALLLLMNLIIRIIRGKKKTII